MDIVISYVILALLFAVLFFLGTLVGRVLAANAPRRLKVLSLSFPICAAVVLGGIGYWFPSKDSISVGSFFLLGSAPSCGLLISYLVLRHFNHSGAWRVANVEDSTRLVDLDLFFVHGEVEMVKETLREWASKTPAGNYWLEEERALQIARFLYRGDSVETLTTVITSPFTSGTLIDPNFCVALAKDLHAKWHKQY